MANTRIFSAAAAATAAPSATAATASSRPPSPNRHRLRAVAPDEVVRPADVSAFLTPGATWLPAPQHTLPALPGRPPMVGYLVLVPADQQSAIAAATAQYLVPADAGTGPVRIDSVQRTAAVNGNTLDLTYLEFELLAHLVAHPHRVHTRDQLVTTVWGYGHVGDGRTVDVHIARLRRKLGAEHRRSIQTVRRVGYKYTP
ncbi:winged helix-turn-helix domain-containing protein [Streptomyces poriferorum]|uniref:Winged helix-turn-helix domain-containing protein n=1 Tax=Streptomyces poriferorum TaxID=2798799 RepID=A0ABY9IXD4_9ACTN|nr:MULTISPECIES: winged helix-turn-helix domain-containing protein [unclassified Streptomyces]MDP5311513.1 winged helix-turn-helix domain-containing protein [Streptomyces sp. Alt4]WLQ47921.1 winged helix-turn-helix domain-containing protein [Streptomyces sp. Alt1]WLQ59394.1 winged helix-turn-helix domain-containing protein [Streptomyces sp. Alt2]WSI62739.1 winged helix-turn-helix domain-containing protein [Streptomyces sp. NBC_01336]